ncbi:hypothetical protein GSF22_24025, partial [Micromonospora echinofusca]|nr:hypothetical protein [Micromonospora echinofusca]
AGGLGGGSGGGVPGGRLGDTYRALPDAPRAKDRKGVAGIDVDGDGVADLGLDGKPLPDARLVEFDGLRGVDVDGDGRPDIGVDGEILRNAPIVQGADGTIGIDVNGDGEPDVGISGQVLPDAPIVTKDGVRGIDLNGDGIPDLGMDRKPLPDATLVELDGIKGVDVNGDGRPDIGTNGEILQFAPMVSTPDGMTGVDVNGDGKPDIAQLGGLTVAVPRGIESIGRTDLPMSTQPAQLATAPTTSLTSAGLGGSQVRHAPAYDDAPTVLTSLGSALAPGPRPVTGDVGRVEGQPAWLAGQPVPHGTLGAEPDTAPHRSALAADRDLWNDDHGLASALGRPSHGDEWED